MGGNCHCNGLRRTRADAPGSALFERQDRNRQEPRHLNRSTSVPKPSRPDRAAWTKLSRQAAGKPISNIKAMVRWIAFDDDTAEAVVTRFKRGAAEIQHGDPVSLALGAQQPSLLILPSDAPGRVVLAHFQPKAIAEEAPIRYQASGFLGLSDEPVYTQPSQPELETKKKWWQRRRSA